MTDISNFCARALARAIASYMSEEITNISHLRLWLVSSYFKNIRTYAFKCYPRFALANITYFLAA